MARLVILGRRERQSQTHGSGVDPDQVVGPSAMGEQQADVRATESDPFEATKGGKFVLSTLLLG